MNAAEVAFSGRCPGCGYDSPDYRSVELEDCAWQVVHCPRCHASWSETYVRDSIYIRDPGDRGVLTIDDEIDLPEEETDMATTYTIYEFTTTDADTLTYIGEVEATSAVAAVRKFFSSEERGPRSVPDHVAAIPKANVHTFAPKVETQTRLTL